jgi:RNA polymerase sigma factor (sigma-70 family)
MNDSQKLLAEFVANGSEPAFRELVTRYAGLVCSTANRLVGGDLHLAQDVAQAVFVDLARKAHKLAPDVMLGGWLHRDTCFVAANLMRSERRRQFRERQAAAMNDMQDHSETNLARLSPILDEAINQLGAADRALILLRFFEQRNLSAVGEALGSTENAVQKRLSRALEKLRGLLKHRGVALSAAALVTVLASESVTAAPAGLALSLSSSALFTASATPASTFTFLKFMAATKLKVALVSSIVIASVLTPLLVQRQAQAKVREQDSLLGQQRDQLAQLAGETERLANLTKQSNQSAREAQLAELLKLRGEAELLRGQTKEADALREENRRLRPPATTAALTPLQQRELVWAKQECAQGWARAFIAHAQANQGRLPDTFANAEPYLPKDVPQGTGVTSDQFEILYHGTLDSLTNQDPGLNVILFREKSLWPLANGDGSIKFGRFDALANGGAQYGSVPAGTLDDNFFSEYENSHIATPNSP